MLPHASATPDLQQLEPKIAPLVKVLNDMELITHWSCEGHGGGFKLCQSPYPAVVIQTESKAVNILISRLGQYNQSVRYDGGMEWVIEPTSQEHFVLRPEYVDSSIDAMHQGILDLVSSFEKMQSQTATS